jgi:hypothetical protein
MSAPDGILVDYPDENMRSMHKLSIQEFVDAWAQGVPFGTPLPAQAARGGAWMVD